MSGWKWSDIWNGPKKLILDIYNSLNTDNSGFSLRKVLACVGMYAAVKISFEQKTTIASELVWSWILFILLCVGLVTVDKLIQLKTGGVTKKEETTLTTTSTSTEVQAKKEDKLAETAP